VQYLRNKGVKDLEMAGLRGERALRYDDSTVATRNAAYASRGIEGEKFS
jgi:hypothetical protein